MNATDNAFPVYQGQECRPEYGIDIRTYIAAQVLNGLLSNGPLIQGMEAKVTKNSNLDAGEIFAKMACSYADSFIAELNKSNS